MPIDRHRTPAGIALALVLSLGLGLAVSGCEEKAPVDPPAPSIDAEVGPPPAVLMRVRQAAGDHVHAAWTVAVEEAEAEAEARRPPLLWVVDGPQGPVYLFGTIHLGVSGRLADLPAPVREAFEASEIFVMEADPRQVDEAQMSSMILLPPDESLDEKLSKAAWEALVDRLDAPPEMLRRMRPWVVQTLLMEQSMKRVELDVRGERMDQQLFAAALAREMELGFLEDWKAQVALMNRVLEAHDIEALAVAPDALDDMVRGLIEAYRSQDADALEAHLFDPELIDPKQYDRIFRKRNAQWVPKLRRLIERGDVFVAVGAGHLLGEHRLQRMLEERGYTVRRVEADPSGEAAREAEPE